MANNFLETGVWAAGEFVTAEKLNKMKNESVNYSPDSESSISVAWIPYHISSANISDSNNGLSSYSDSDSLYKKESAFEITDGNKTPFAYFSGYLQKDGISRAEINVTNGNNQLNYIRLLINKEGEMGYKIANPAAFRKEIQTPNYTILGTDSTPTVWVPYHISASNISASNNGINSSDNILDGYAITDGQGNIAAFFGCNMKSSGEVVATLRAINNGHTNRITLTIDKNGTCSYAISDPAAFRAALGIS